MMTRTQTILGRVRPLHHAAGAQTHERPAALRRPDHNLSNALRAITFHPHFAPTLWRLGRRALPLRIERPELPSPTVIRDRNKIHHPEPDQPGKGPIPLYIDQGIIGDQDNERDDHRDDIIGDKPDPESRRPPERRDDPNPGERGVVIIEDNNIDTFTII